MTKLLLAPGELPGCSGARNLQNNISDLRAQVAANQKVSVGELNVPPFISRVLECNWFVLIVSVNFPTLQCD